MTEPSDHKKPDQPEMRPHVYDGIQEFDNRMPNWWLWTFYLTIIFSAIYWFTRYDAGFIKMEEEKMDEFQAQIEEARLAARGDINADTLWEMSRNDGFVSQGRTVYQNYCMACHGQNLEGGIGNNLVDDQWVWGNTPMSIYEVVANGSPDRMSGMQAWIGDLGAQRVNQVVAYILSYHDPDSMAAASTENDPIAD